MSNKYGVTLATASVFLYALAGPAVAAKLGGKGFSSGDIFGEFAITSVGTAAFSTVGVANFMAGEFKNGTFTIVINQPVPADPIQITCTINGDVSLQANGKGTASLTGDCDTGGSLDTSFQVVVTEAKASGEVTSLRAVQLTNTTLDGLSILDLTKIVHK